MRPGQLTDLLRAIAALPDGSEEPQEAPDLKPGDRVGRFEIRRALGRGGFGVVYEALDTTLLRSVALKTVRRRSRTTLPDDRLLLEADAAARLSHPNIVTLHDAGVSIEARTWSWRCCVGSRSTPGSSALAACRPPRPSRWRWGWLSGSSTRTATA